MTHDGLIQVFYCLRINIVRVFEEKDTNENNNSIRLTITAAGRTFFFAPFSLFFTLFCDTRYRLYTGPILPPISANVIKVENGLTLGLGKKIIFFVILQKQPPQRQHVT